MWSPDVYNKQNFGKCFFVARHFRHLYVVRPVVPLLDAQRAREQVPLLAGVAEVAVRDGEVVAPAPEAQPAETSESVGWQNFGKMLLVFGCIGSDFCKKICVLQHFSKSTRFST